MRRYKPRKPYRKRSRAGAQRSARRKFTNRARYRNRRRPAIFRNPFIFPKAYTKLKYAQAIVLDPKPEAMGATGSNVWQFCANGLYDPDTTGTGHQPMYYDNYSALYQRYRVRQSFITVTVVNTGTSSYNGSTITPAFSYRLFITQDCSQGLTNQYPADMGEAIEEGNSNTKWRFVAPSLNGRLPKLKNRCNPHILASLGRDEDTLAAATNANPAQSCYYYVGITSSDGVTDPPSCSLYIQITYMVEFFDRIPLQPQN